MLKFAFHAEEIVDDEHSATAIDALSLSSELGVLAYLSPFSRKVFISVSATVALVVARLKSLCRSVSKNSGNSYLH